MADKDFKTIDEQIEILRSRGLTIEDEAEAKDFLLRNNYYRVSGYSLTLRKNDVFAKSATFQNIEDIYNFDHEFRHIILHHIETIEVQMKSIYAYEFTKVYGPLGYLDAANFSNQAKHKEIVNKANQQKRQRLAHEAYLKHFINDLHQEIPLWAYVDLLTISDISFLYSISERPLKETIAHRFGLTMNRGPEILGQYMHSMTIIRNLCAHGSRIYNRLFEQKPSLNKKEQALLIRRKDGTMDNSHFFGFFLIMRRLLPAENFVEMKEGLNCSILFAPSEYVEAFIPFNITCGTLLKYQILLAFTCTISVTGITLLMSAISKNQIVALVAAMAIFLFPVLLPIPETNPLFRLVGLLPVYHVLAVSLLSVEQMSNGMLYAIWAIPTALIFLGIGAGFSRHIFAKHQVS